MELIKNGWPATNRAELGGGQSGLLSAAVPTTTAQASWTALLKVRLLSMRAHQHKSIGMRTRNHISYHGWTSNRIILDFSY
jgi:hypothetical protein